MVSLGQYPPARPTPRQEGTWQVAGIIGVIALFAVVIGWASYQSQTDCKTNGDSA